MLKEKIKTDFKEAFKAKERVKLSVLKMVNAAIGNAEIEKRAKAGGVDTPLTDAEVMDILSKEAKKRKDSIEQYKAGGREDLAQSEQAELNVLKEYLPAQMSEEEIKSLAQKVIAEVGASSSSDLGKVMSALTSQTKGRADGALVSKIVREALGN
ncbi:TPA: glutamyl-tRNA amidotransferase [Patescibacteria group bacterium]|nr:MAG: hypothetical protein UT71_C0002G0048 [Parcubacteria group bacterium GW2011_GWF2_40_10]KKR47825.1 MAG: hypothetical protein UT83_C0003G0038 [Parcubacteria group bacterium GW2011_GWA2_40_143]KKR60256.1 MAG: hypothetical protein UT97_C0003G0038 [Parcubacteria group bacterium GW2011_GWC2_40_31]KKR74487.1 MAG: hypothetical protein UU18_C0026G0003 [Parcubacteria group bacterium GW2011_GWB2_40_8]KKR77404.1 MAG: hypothetical protein UU20_C0008G0017 [Parcubacteria group bacterium GW2011_GWE2_40_